MSWYEPKPAWAELRATVLEDFVAALPVTTSRREFADATVTYLARNPRASQAELGSFLGLNPRQTYRRCTYGFGYGSATLTRILRFQRFLAVTASGPYRRSIARAATEAGYTDQAHLSRDCRAITGQTPKLFFG